MYNKGGIPSLKLPWPRWSSFLFVQTKTFWTISWRAKHKKQGSHACTQFQVTRPLESCCFWLRPIDSFSKLNDLSPLRNCLSPPLKPRWFCFVFFFPFDVKLIKKLLCKEEVVHRIANSGVKRPEQQQIQETWRHDHDRVYKKHPYTCKCLI